VSTLQDEVFRDFVVARQRALLRTAFLLTGDQGMAEDLVQTALEKTVRRWSGGGGGPASLEAYVRRVMYREQVSRWRRHRLVEVPAAELPEWRLDSRADDGLEDHIVLQRALQQIGRRQRAVLVLRYYEDLSEQQVADVLGISLGTVKSQAHRGLARLREAFGGLEAALGGGSR
jgi:RNA polymerase sigma-70 factor (sigma-E family)